MLGCSQTNGYVSDNTDCDDADATINPNSSEVCNDIDDNCNLLVDEGVPVQLWYYDLDGDGYGDPSTAIEDCSSLTNMVLDSDDCDDGDPLISPGADELCGDSIDNNCDGFVDDETAIDAFGGYLDVDQDGYGGGDYQTGCDDIYLVSNLDCDDDDPAINPSIQEVCDGIDNDCDGAADDASVCPCSFERYNDHPYLFCTQNRTWSVAKGECAQYGYYLTTIEDASENAWLDSVADGYSSGRWWIGINDITVENYWDWDGPYTTFESWNNGQPDGGSNENCGLLNQQSGADWSDANCSTSIYFVCEASP